jgi:hypothetical protein
VGLRPLLPAFALALCALGGTASSAPPEEGARPPRGVRGLEIAIKATEARLQTLIGLADEKQEALYVRWYRNQTAEDFKEPKREVRVDDHLWKKVVLEKGVPEETKKAAADAIIAAADLDPDLSKEGRGPRRKRVEFLLKVARELDHDDLVVRVLASKILGELWPNATDPDILQYDPDSKRTWGVAQRRWEQTLRR